MSAFGRAFLDALDPDDLRRLADLVAERLTTKVTATASIEDGWLSTKQAAAYVGLSVASVHRLAAEGSIPFEQDGPGCKLWFRRSELDGWRRGEARALTKRIARPGGREPRLLA